MHFSARQFGMLEQPTGAVDSSHPQLAQWVAVGDPTLVGRLTAARVLLGRNADPHLAERRRVVALTAAPANERAAKAVNGLQFVVAGTLPSQHYRAGTGELSGEHGHRHEAGDYATTNQICL